MLPKFIFLSLTLFGVSCGNLIDFNHKKENEESETKEEAFAKAIDEKNQKKCNEDGFFYDNLERLCTKTPLAEWECSLDGLKKRISDPKLEEIATELVEEKVAKDFELYQCGEKHPHAELIFLKKINGAKTVEVQMLKTSIILEEVQ